MSGTDFVLRVFNGAGVNEALCLACFLCLNIIRCLKNVELLWHFTSLNTDHAQLCRNFNVGFCLHLAHNTGMIQPCFRTSGYLIEPCGPVAHICITSILTNITTHSFGVCSVSAAVLVLLCQQLCLSEQESEGIYSSSLPLHSSTLQRTSWMTQFLKITFKNRSVLINLFY